MLTWRGLCIFTIVLKGWSNSAQKRAPNQECEKQTKDQPTDKGPTYRQWNNATSDTEASADRDTWTLYYL